MKDNIILTKTYDFALRIVRLYIKLKDLKEFEISRQLLRSGTSIGANAEEGSVAQSKKDFIAKFSISLKETRETIYWLRLLKDSNLIDSLEASRLICESEEIQRILTSILKTAKNNTN